MEQLQDIFNRIQESKKEEREIKSMYKDALASAPQYQEIKEKLEDLRRRKKQIEEAAWMEAGSREKAEELKLSIQQDKELLSDLALSTLMKGETVKVVDRNNQEYEPAFSVKFKKA